MLIIYATGHICNNYLRIIFRHNGQFFDTSSISIEFNEEYRQYNSILHFILLVLFYTFLYKTGSGGTDYVNLMDSVRHELEHSSFFSIFHSCIHVYSKKSPPDFKRKNDTYRIAPSNTC